MLFNALARLESHDSIPSKKSFTSCYLINCEIMTSLNGNCNKQMVAQKHSRITPKVICTFKPPPKQQQPLNSDISHMRSIYATQPILRHNEWCIGASWYGKIHSKKIYDEPIRQILASETKCDPLFYWINDNHERYKAFSQWWVTQTQTPSLSPNMNQVIYVQRLGEYVHILDVIPTAKCFIFPGYEHCQVCSGKALILSSPALQYKLDGTGADLIFSIMDNDEVIVFDSIDAARCDYMVRESEAGWVKLLKMSTVDKVRLGQNPAPLRARIPVANVNFILDNFLRDKLKENGVELEERGKYIRFEMNNDKMENLFGNDVSLRKEDGNYEYYLEQIKVLINKDLAKMTVQCVLLKKKKKKNANNEHNIEGLSLLG